MKYIRRYKHRYGDKDFDQDYLKWGFHDAETQTSEARSVLRLLASRAELRILDLACGAGRHAVYWAAQGHDVLGVDLSETFVNEAQKLAGNCPLIHFQVADIRNLDFVSLFDAVTWIERSFLDESTASGISRALKPGGVFITDVRNPEHPRTKQRTSNWRSWRGQDGVYQLERHEDNPATNKHEDVWITVDVEKQLVIEEYAECDCKETALAGPGCLDAMLKSAGFRDVELRTMEGVPFAGGPDPYWLWLMAYKA
jgi:SAM-dependent methyltransferase